MGKIASVAGGLVLFLSSPAWSDVSETSDPTVKTLLTASIEQERLSSPSGREALVSASRDYCRQLDRSYPRNSPAEDAWVNEEAHGDGDRPARLLRSAEFGRRMAANFVGSCLQAAQFYQANGDKRGALLAMALAFARFGGDAKYYATKNNVDVDKFALDLLPRATVEALLVAALAVH